MKAFYFRNHDWGMYLVPVERIEAFDRLCKKIADADKYSTKWDKLCKQFVDRYKKYECEGNLTTIKLWIETNDNLQK